jgi:hypothetical protein
LRLHLLRSIAAEAAKHHPQAIRARRRQQQHAITRRQAQRHRRLEHLAPHLTVVDAAHLEPFVFSDDDVARCRRTEQGAARARPVRGKDEARGTGGE